jgi:hypothetical protein
VSKLRLIPPIAAVAVAVALAAPSPAFAVGTAANTIINNRAGVTYSVGGTPQAVIESTRAGNTTPGAGNGADTTFLVDRMLDLTVGELGASYTTVVGGATAQVLTFNLANTGNDVQDFSFTATNRASATAGPFGGTDNFDATGVIVRADVNGNGTYEPLTDTATFADELAADANTVVFVVGSIPNTQVDGDLSVLTLTAQVAAGGAAAAQGADIVTDDAASADDPNAVQNVFADGAGDTDAANDGQHSDTDGYSVASASLTIQKTSAVISDPVNLGVNPKSIPGAIVEYTVVISNDPTASASATNVTLSDDLSTEIGLGTVAFETDSYGVGQGIELTPPGGGPTPLTNAVDPDQGDFGGTGADTVTVSGITLAAGETATITYRVQVQ